MTPAIKEGDLRTFYHFATTSSSKSTISTVTMQNFLCFTLIFLSAALSAQGGIPDNLKSFFLPAGVPAVANSEYPIRQHSEQGPDAASASGSEKERMSHLQSAIDEARRSYNAGDFSRYMTSKPVDMAECYVKETV
ncbi:hypothetical protein AVEN_85032-1, partial [Araneus ventricosus]